MTPENITLAPTARLAGLRRVRDVPVPDLPLRPGLSCSCRGAMGIAGGAGVPRRGVLLSDFEPVNTHSDRIPVMFEKSGLFLSDPRSNGSAREPPGPGSTDGRETVP